MEILKSAFYFLAVLSVLVVVHEWGHFIVAKLFGMRVEDFSLFFGKKLICLGVRNGTEYNIRAIPLGGFVRISGMEPEDFAHGSALFKRSGKRQASDRFLRGLEEEALRGINFENVSDRVAESVENGVNNEGRLTTHGRQELESLLLSTTLHEDEHRYIQAVLNAKERPLDPHGYNQKPLWQRAAVIFAGPFMSLFFGYVLFCVMGFTTGLPDRHTENVVATVVKDKPAYRAGIRPADRIVNIDGTPIPDGKTMVRIIRGSIGKPLNLTIERAGKTLPITVTPEPDQADVEENGKIVRKTVGLIGIGPKITPIWKRYPPMEAIRTGTEIITFQVTATITTIFSRDVGNNVGGIITIGRQIHDDSKEGLRRVLLTAASLSISLGILNLFPIPVLDGGHLVLLAWEGLRRRKLSSKEVYTAQLFGLTVILVLFVLVMYKDITRLFPGK